MSRPSRAWILELAIITTIGLQPAAALEEAVGHVELAPTYTTSSSTWAWKTHWIDNDLETREDAVGTIFFPGRDIAPASPGFGVRNVRPAASRWDFLGVGAGEPVWIFIDTSYVSAGFSANPANLSGDLVFKLDSVTGPAGGHFSLYSGTTPVIYMQTIDGITAADEFRKPLNHTHVNWAFSRKGIWIVNLRVQGTVAATGAPTATSPAQPIVFAIGNHARWKASFFNAAELSDPTISGDAADPDGDGMNNLAEYALGGNPRVSSATRANDLQPLAPRLLSPATAGAAWRLSFFRQTPGAETDVSYTVESSSTLAAGSWTPETATAEILSTTGGWQQVAVPLSQPPLSATNPRFFRLKLAIIP